MKPSRAPRLPLPALVGLVTILVVAIAAILTGCGSPPSGERAPGIFAQALAGTDDVELTYEIDGTAPGPGATGRAPAALFGEDLRALVLRRLGSAQVGADVTQEGRRVKIVVDEALGPRVDELVTWTGTLLVFDPDPDVLLTPRDPSSRLTAVQDPATREQWFEGSRADVLRAIDQWPIDRDHRILAEALWDRDKDGGAPPRWRTRVVKIIPVGELGDGAMVSRGENATLRIRGAAGTLAEQVIKEAKARKMTPVVARGRISLGAPLLEADALRISFGNGTEAYAREQRERHLLTTPRLPPLKRVDAMGLPPNRSLAIACLVVPVVLSLAWLVFVRRFDRAHPEPMWLVGVTFLLGAISTAPAGLAEYALAQLSPYLDPNLVTFGGQTAALPLAIVVFTLVVGLSEEGAKRLAAHFAIRRREFDEPVDGIVYGIVASLGFAAAENIRYFAIGRMAAPLVIARCFMSVPAHMFFGAVWGYALGVRLLEPDTKPWRWLLLAAFCHGLFDALLSTEGAGMLAVMLNVGLASVFVVLVRRALRHGVVTKEMLGMSIKPEDRVFFRVGRPVLFWLSAVALHVLAFGIFLLGAYYQLARHRPSTTFVVGSSVMLALLAVAALGVSQTMPLDVAIDAYGVTFAGAARAWRKIRRFHVHLSHGRVPYGHIELDCEAGPILLGPAPRPTIEAMSAALAERLGGDGKDGSERLLTLESSR